MSGGGWDEIKRPFYQVAQKDSQNLKHLGQKWNIGFLEDEAAHNEKNPGRAITKAAEYAAMGYLGGLYGGLYDSAGAYAAATPALTASGEQAAMLASQTGEFGANGLLQTAASGGNQYAGTLAKMASGSGTSAGGKQLALQAGMNAMQPAQRPPMQSAPPPRQQQPMEPLPLAYGQRMDSLGMGLTEEEKRRRMMMGGYR